MGMVTVEGKEAVFRGGINLGRPIVTTGNGDALFPNYFGEDLFIVVVKPMLVESILFCVTEQK